MPSEFQMCRAQRHWDPYGNMTIDDKLTDLGVNRMITQDAKAVDSKGDGGLGFFERYLTV